MNKIKFNRNGFTLIELLAVIVILAVIMLVAGANVFTVINNASRGTFRNEFLSLLTQANTQAQFDMMNGEFKGASSKCYKLIDITSWENKNAYKGSVLVTKAADGKFTFKGWMSSSEFIITNKDNTLANTAEAIPPASGAVASELCK